MSIHGEKQLLVFSTEISNNVLKISRIWTKHKHTKFTFQYAHADFTNADLKDNPLAEDQYFSQVTCFMYLYTKEAAL